MPPLFIPPQNKRRYYYIGASILLVVLGGVRLFESAGSGGEIFGFELVGGMMILAGLMLGLSTVQTVRRRNHAVVMDEEGVTIQVPNVGHIEWDEIVAVRTDMVRSRAYVHIILRDPAAVLLRDPSLGRYIAENEIWFDASEIDMSPRDLADAIIERRNAARRS